MWDDEINLDPLAGILESVNGLSLRGSRLNLVIVLPACSLGQRHKDRLNTTTLQPKTWKHKVRFQKCYSHTPGMSRDSAVSVGGTSDESRSNIFPVPARNGGCDEAGQSKRTRR